MMSEIENNDGLFIVRRYDAMDNQWMDVSDPLPYEEAHKVWMNKTENRSKHIWFAAEKEYYGIFLASTPDDLCQGLGGR